MTYNKSQIYGHVKVKKKYLIYLIVILIELTSKVTNLNNIMWKI